MTARAEAPANERRIAFSTAQIPVFTIMVCVGIELQRLERGHVLRIHQFGRTNTNGEESKVSPYQLDSLEAAIRESIKRAKLPYALTRDGLDLLVAHQQQGTT